MTDLLNNIKGIIIDMDGVLWLGEKPMRGLQEFFQRLEEKQVRWVLATNNSSKTPQQYALKLSGFGVKTSPSQVLTSAKITADYLSKSAPAGSVVYMIGSDGLAQALKDAGFVISDQNARYVVVGWDQALTWEKLARASLLIHQGAEFIGTNPDPSYPTSEGPVPGCGAQLQALTAATGVAPLIMGKPGQHMYLQALDILKTAPKNTAMLGDRIDTDLAGAQALGIKTILVLSGVVSPTDLADSFFQPDLIRQDLEEVTHSWA